MKKTNIFINEPEDIEEEDFLIDDDIDVSTKLIQYVQGDEDSEDEDINEPSEDYISLCKQAMFNPRHIVLRDALKKTRGNYAHLVRDRYEDTKMIANALINTGFSDDDKDEIRIKRRAVKLLQACLAWVEWAGSKENTTILSVRRVLNAPLEEKLKPENQYEADALLQYGPLEEIFLAPDTPQWITFLYMESKMTDECDRYDVLFEAADALTDVLYTNMDYCGQSRR